MCEFCENILDENSEEGIDRNHMKLDESIKSFADGVNGLWEVLRKGICND